MTAIAARRHEVVPQAEATQCACRRALVLSSLAARLRCGQRSQLGWITSALVSIFIIIYTHPPSVYTVAYR
jgi:hypothetical protein